MDNTLLTYLRCVVRLVCVLTFIMAAAVDSRAAELTVQQAFDFDFIQDHSGLPPDFGFFIEYHDELYFTAATPNGNRLFKTDGHNLDQFDVDPGTPRGISRQFVEFQNELYFRGGGADGVELYKTDGITLTNLDLTTAELGSGPHSFEVVGGRLYLFGATLNDLGEYTTHLFVSDGTTITTLAETSTQDSYPWKAVVGDTVYVTANGPDGFELFQTDGITTQQVADINPGTGNSNPLPGLTLNGEFYFTAVGPLGRELYKTDGTEVTKLPLAPDTAPSEGPNNFVLAGESLFFSAQLFNGYELFRTNGEAITEFDLNPGAASSGGLANLRHVLGDQLLIAARGPNGKELSVIDGDSVREFDINPGPDDSTAFRFREFAGEVYFLANDSDGRGLYKTDGHNLSELEIAPGLVDTNAFLTDAVEFGGELFFSAKTPNGWELVKTDGNIVTTFDVNPGAADAFPAELTVFEDRLIFTAFGTDGQGIYSTDGSSIQQLADLNPFSEVNEEGFLLPSITSFARFDDDLLFIARTADGYRLHRVTTIPEPSSWTLAILGFAAAMIFIYRRR